MNKEEVCGVVERITFQNPETGFTVAKVKLPRRADLACFIGTMPMLQNGETVRCHGEWKNHMVHGQQFEVTDCKTERPANVEAIKKYLSSSLIKGIGPVYAEKIVDKFGLNTLDVLDRSPESLLQIPGIGQKRVDQIRDCWNEQKIVRDVMIFLQSQGVSPAYAQKIYRRYGDDSIEKIQDNPFHLARDIFGIGFKIADSIAEKMGIPKNSPKRIDAGLEYLLEELGSEGHVCYPQSELLAKGLEMFEVPIDLLQERIADLVRLNRFHRADLLRSGERTPFLWIKKNYLAEQAISKSLWRLKNEVSSLRDVDREKAIEWVQEQLHLTLASLQQDAVSAALKEKVLIITGGPGTGKSTITRAILEISKKLTSRIFLAAPTGRAAKRMEEITGRKAKTIHSLLEVDFRSGGFKRGRKDPLECDLIIVDELSMIDTQLMASLLLAIPDHARVVFVGDVNQLPSVGPGNVLKDLIASQRVPVIQLTDIFRQAAGSKITLNAHRINDGIFPRIEHDKDSDFFFLEAEDVEEAKKIILNLVIRRLPKKYGFDPVKDIQVLAPMKKGGVGTITLNQSLQSSLIETEEGILRHGQTFHVGDKVMQIRNNYKKEVFNGDMGQIKEIDFDLQTLLIDFEGRLVQYEASDLDEIVLAYAVSIHKSQGSEFPCVVIPVHTAHFIMLHRNLLYTGITRGKKMVILVGTKKAIAMAVSNDEVKERFTGLTDALRGIVYETN